MKPQTTKLLLLLLAAYLFPLVAVAATDEYEKTEGTRVLYVTKDPKGKVLSYDEVITNYRVGDSLNYYIVLEFRNYDKNMKLLKDDDNPILKDTITFVNGKNILGDTEEDQVKSYINNLKAELGEGLENITITTEGSMFFPKEDMKIGDEFPPYSITMDFGIGKLKIKFYDIKVLGDEALTINDQVYQCKVYQQTNTAKFSIFVNETITTKIWQNFEYDIEIRTEEYKKNGRLESVRELLSIEQL